jgi:glycosyltransferase involved in cell wall biosynthesis
VRGARLRLLHVGTTENKNLPRVIEACRDLAITLVIVGVIDPTSAARLLVLGVHHENHVQLDDAALVEVYRASDALIFASTYEGFGLPIIEAQAIGRPVITSRVCSMPEASGGAALLVDPYDVADIRRAIQSLLDDPHGAAERVERGYQNAARYSPELIGAAYAELYRRAHSGSAAADDGDQGTARQRRGGAGRGGARTGTTRAGAA